MGQAQPAERPPNLIVRIDGEAPHDAAVRRAFERHQRVSIQTEPADVGAVCVAVSPETMRERTQDALHRDGVVLCVCPPARSPADLRAFRELTARYGSTLVVLPRLRYLVPAAEARLQLATGAVGPAVALRLVWQIASGQDPLTRLGPEALDYVRWCLGAEVERLHAVGGRCQTDNDMVTITLRMTNGVIAQVELESVLPGGFPREQELFIEMHGETGTILVTPNHQQVTLFGEQGRSPVWDGWVAPPEEAMVDELVRCCLDGAEPSATLDDLGAALDLVDRARAQLAGR